MRIDPLHPWKIGLRKADDALKGSPFLLLGGRARAARRFAGQLEVRSIRLQFPDLPKAWDGVTLTHLTDLHVGPMFRPDLHLPPVIAACRELASDLIVVTGDWIDHKNRFLPAAIERLRELRPPLGWWGVVGNHDFHDHRWRLLRALREWLGGRLLLNRTALLEQGGEKLALSGLDYAMSPLQRTRHLEAWRWQRQRQWSEGADAPFEIALAHHPREFDPLRAAGVRLVLAGHTHGGQISLTPAPMPVVGPAMYKFRYLRGLYERDGARLLVSCGLGHSVPLRINCPPEIWQVKLVRG
jgi:hypothetical protein